MLRNYENGAIANGTMLVSKVKVTDESIKGLFPVFNFPVEGITYVWPEKNSGAWDFPRTGVNIL